MKLSRRALLLAGLGTSAAVSGAKEQARINKILTQQDPGARELANEPSIIDAAYASEATWDEEVAKRKALLSSETQQQPLLPYNREISRQLIQFCKLAVQQYKTGRENSTYGGSIELLPDYHESLNSYTQLANFTTIQESLESYFSEDTSAPASDSITAIGETFEKVELTLRDRIRQILQHKHRVTVYSGIALTSSDHNILVFRGTQTQAEWLKNINAKQVTYISPSGQAYGEVHKGFLESLQQLQPSLTAIAQQLDPSIPCYVTGHSLGAAIATLAAFELVQIAPQLKDRIQLYAFAGPRVASPTFAKFYSQFIPNAYRIVNASDTVPLIPPVNLGNTYMHVGQEWSFLTQFGDTLLNHVVDTYRAALEREAETDRAMTMMQPLDLSSDA